jgi:hypothetical protein
VTLELPEESPVSDLPWIITYGPLNDEEDWEPVVCGPYERRHALALAEEVVADEELMAVVEPLMSFVGPDEMRAEIEVARAAAQVPDGVADDLVIDDDDPEAHHDHSAHESASLPDPDEVRAGMARLAARFGAGPSTPGEPG